MRWKNDKMLLRIAQADAFAAAVEYVKRKDHPGLYEAVERFDSYQQHPTHPKLRPGTYTDDGQMSVSVAEVLLQGRSPTPHDFTDKFFEVFKRDQRDGYSRGFQSILESSRTADELRFTLKPDSNKNGAAMRSVPLGVLKDQKRVVELATMQAATTHNTFGGINSSIIVALMSHFALYDGRGFLSMRSFVNHRCEAARLFREPWEGPVDSKPRHGHDLGVGMNTAWAVMTLLEEEKSLTEIMRRIVAWGGDTDSVGAIAWGIASCRYQEEVLPEFLERDLEHNGNLRYGPSFLKSLGERLMQIKHV